MGSWVIIGNRSWETVIEGKLPKCDLLEIYTNQEKNRLIQECKVNLSALLREEQKQMNLDDQTEQDNIVFSLEDNNTFEKETIKENGTNTHEEEDDFDIDFDNI